jgi:CDP-diglyceride synthetase
MVAMKLKFKSVTTKCALFLHDYAWWALACFYLFLMGNAACAVYLDPQKEKIELLIKAFLGGALLFMIDRFAIPRLRRLSHWAVHGAHILGLGCTLLGFHAFFRIYESMKHAQDFRFFFIVWIFLAIYFGVYLCHKDEQRLLTEESKSDD